VSVEKKDVKNKKDNFNAKNLLAKKFEEITLEEDFSFRDDPEFAYRDNSAMSLMSLCNSDGKE